MAVSAAACSLVALDRVTVVSYYFVMGGGEGMVMKSQRKPRATCAGLQEVLNCIFAHMCALEPCTEGKWRSVVHSKTLNLQFLTRKFIEKKTRIQIVV